MSASQPLTLHLIGLGVSERTELASSALQALQQAKVVIGSQRQLDSVAQLLPANTQTQLLPKLSELREQLLAQQSDLENIAILASGDPLFYGIGRWFSQHFSNCELNFYPAVSSLQVACHRLGIALQDVEVLSLHGRPLAKLKTRLRARQPLLVLTDSHSSPQALARLCVETGFINTRLTVLERLGYADEKISAFSAAALAQREQNENDFAALHLTLLEPEENRGYLPQFPGIADQHFITDGKQPGQGMLTKREVRLQVLSLLQPQRGDQVWDIGAGCGGVAVELAYWQPDCQVTAIEHHPERFACLEANRERFGVVSNLQLIQGRAPQALRDLATPNRVFIGGSDGELPALLEQVWSRLDVPAVLVATAVTEQSKQHLLNFMQQRQAAADTECETVCETLQLAVSRGETLGGQMMYRPNLPVSLFRFSRLPAPLIEKQNESS